MVSRIGEDEAGVAMRASAKKGWDGGCICDELFSYGMKFFVGRTSYEDVYLLMWKIFRDVGDVFRHHDGDGAATKRRANQTKSVSS